MTEKRFSYNVNKNTIEQDGKFVAYVSSVGGVIIANKLNVFQKENEQLKSKLSEQGTQIDFLKDENKHMRKVLEENKELKDLLKSMANRNDEIWLDNGQIIRLKKVFKGEWTND